MLLFAALAVAFVLPPEQLLLDPPWLRYLLAAIVAFAPVFLANLVFTFSFRDTKIADMAFASNLLGAMVRRRDRVAGRVAPGPLAQHVPLLAVPPIAWASLSRRRRGGGSWLGAGPGVGRSVVSDPVHEGSEALGARPATTSLR